MAWSVDQQLHSTLDQWRDPHGPPNMVVDQLTKLASDVRSLGTAVSDATSQLAGLASWAAVTAAARSTVNAAQGCVDAAKRVAAAISPGPLPSDPAALSGLLGDLGGLRVTAWPDPREPGEEPAYRARMAELDAALAALLGAWTGAGADTPVALLPVHLETRTAPGPQGGTELRIRVHVDDLHIDAHDPRLTTDEVAWSQQLRAAIAAGGDTARRVWAQTADRVGAARAAYLLNPFENDEVQRVSLMGEVTGGSFTLKFGGQETAPIAYNASAPAAQSALTALTTIGTGNVVVTGGPDPPHLTAWTVTYQGSLAGQSQPLLTIARNSLIGPPRPTPFIVMPPTVTIAETMPGGLATRTSVWGNAARARCLPERWLAVAYGADGAPLAASLGLPITIPLQVGPDPDKAGAPVTAGDVPVDAGLRWLVNFDAAVAAGMGLRLPLDGGATLAPAQPIPLPPGPPPSPVAPPLSRIMVVGINPGDGATELAQLLDAHHFTDGLELLAAGTPTNNTPQVRAGFSTADPGSARSFHLEVGDSAAARPPPSADAARLAGALGIDPAVLTAAGDPMLGAQDQQAAIALCWSATWRKLLLTMVRLVRIDEQRVERLRSWAVAWLRPSGPLPTLRIGAQPYGVLPILALRDWADPDDRAATDVRHVVTQLLPSWRAAAEAIAHGQPDFNSLLERRAVSADVRGRFAGVTSDWLGQGLGLLDVKPDAIKAREDALPGWLAQIGQLLSGGAPTWPTGYLVLPDITDPSAQPWPLSTPDGTVPLVGDGQSNAPDPYLVALAEGKPAPAAASVLAFLAQASRKTTAAASTTAGFVARGNLGEKPEPAAPPAPDELQGAIAHLAGRQAADVTGPLGGALDAASHRLDAWATALATRRLGQLRSSTKTLLVGGFGWVEDFQARQPLQPANPPVTNEPGALVDPDNAGYIHAPSLQQATTAAVLRSGYLTHNPTAAAPGAAAPFAVDLSSRRARLGTWLLDGVRQGQPLAALLGYRFERTLQQAGRADLIDDIRQAAPHDPAHPPDATSPGAQEAVRATDVVDGVTLYERYEAGTLTGDIRPGRPWTTPEVTAALGELVDAVDAVADGALAEALHESLTGNSTRAVSALHAIATGAVPPPELAFLQTPRTGIAINHRVIVPLPLATATPPTGWPATPRGRADPAMDAWAAALLGDPSTAMGTVALLDAHDQPLTGADAAVPITLRQLGLGALDVLAVSDRPAEVEQLAVHTVLTSRRSTDAAAASGRLHDNPPTASRALGDVMAVARAAARLLATSRAADARDVASAGTQPDPRVNLIELAARVTAAQRDLDATASALAKALPGDPPPGSPQPSSADIPPGATPSDLATALLLALGVGVPGAAPAAAGPGAPLALVGQARAARADVARRQAAVTAAAPPSDADTATELQARLAQLRAAFGGGFTAVAQFSTDPSDLLTRATTLTTIDTADQAQTPDAWITKVAHTRPAITDLMDCCTTAEAMGGPAFSLTIGQLPLPASAARWAAQPFPDGHPPPANTLSLTLVGSPILAGTMAALLVDDWIEVIPSRRETTAITYHYDTPGTQAPQAIMLAVPPTPTSPAWTYADLLHALEDTIQLTRARTVDYADLPQLAKVMLPAIYLDNGPHGVPPAVPVSTPPDYLTPEPGPTIYSVKPVDLQQGSTGIVTVTGVALAGLQAASYSFAGGGITPAPGSPPHVTPGTSGSPDVVDLPVAVDAEAAVGTRAVTAASSDPFLNGPTVTWRPRADSCDTAQIVQQTTDQTHVITVQGHLLVNAHVTLSETTTGQPLGAVTEAVTVTSDTAVSVSVAVAAAPQPSSGDGGDGRWPYIKPHPIRSTPGYKPVGLTLTVTPNGGVARTFAITFQAIVWVSQ